MNEGTGQEATGPIEFLDPDTICDTLFLCQATTAKRYEATIQTSTGTYTESGQGFMSTQAYGGTCDVFGGTFGPTSLFSDQFLFPDQGGGSEPTRPGKGCGDKNHEHEREEECKKPPR